MSHADDKCPTGRLSLSELLDSVGLTKGELAKLMDVSRKTITRMDDQVSDYVMATIDTYRHSDQASENIPTPTITNPPKVKAGTFRPASEYTKAEIKALWKRRGTESDFDIALSLGLVTTAGHGNVFAFRRDYIAPYI